MTDIRKKWDGIYADVAGETPAAAAVLRENAHLLPAEGKALDFACGLGGSALHLARCGLKVSAWDISAIALAKLQQQACRDNLAIKSECLDLEKERFPVTSFDVVVVSRYLCRHLAPALCSLLNAGGLLFYQTYVLSKVSTAGPQNPDYLLRENELLELFSQLGVRYYREDGRAGSLDQGRRDEAYFVGQKRD